MFCWKLLQTPDTVASHSIVWTSNRLQGDLDLQGHYGDLNYIYRVSNPFSLPKTVYVQTVHMYFVFFSCSCSKWRNRRWIGQFLCIWHITSAGHWCTNKNTLENILNRKCPSEHPPRASKVIMAENIIAQHYRYSKSGIPDVLCTSTSGVP